MSKRPAARAPKGQALAAHIREQGRQRREHNKKYPEHAKLRQHQHEQRTLQGFIEWLDDWRHREDLPPDMVTRDFGEATNRARHLAEMGEVPRAKLIGMYLGIDPDKLEAEKVQMLEEIRVAQEKTNAN